MSKKLIRDIVPISHGTSQRVTDEEVIPYLRTKLMEELGEYFSNFDAAELLDVRDVLERMIYLEVDGTTLIAHDKKLDDRGFFDYNRIWHFGG